MYVFSPGRFLRPGLTENPFSERIFNSLFVSWSTLVFEFRIGFGIDRTPTIMWFKCSGSIILMDILVACTFFRQGDFSGQGRRTMHFWNVDLIVYLLVGARSCLYFEFGWGSIGPTIMLFKCSGSIILMDILVACTFLFCRGDFSGQG